MKKLQIQLKSIAKSLSALARQVETVSKQIEKEKPAKAASAKKAAPKKPAEKKVVTKKTPAKKATPGKMSVIDTVNSLIAQSRKGVSVSALREETGFNSRQLSNALYKLTKRGKIESEARGLYVKK